MKWAPTKWEYGRGLSENGATYACFREAIERFCEYEDANWSNRRNEEQKGALGALEEQSDAADDTDYEVVIATRPTTLAGALALLEYIGACDEERDDILTFADPNSDSPREGYAYHTLIGTLIDPLRPLAALPGWFCLLEGPSGQPAGRLFSSCGIRVVCAALGQGAIVAQHEKADRRGKICVLTSAIDR